MSSNWFGTAVLAALVCAGALPRLSAQDANRDAVVTKMDVGDIVERLDKRAAPFKDDFKKAIERGMDGTSIEDRARKAAERLQDAADKLKDVYKDKRDKNDPAVRQQADRTLEAGAEVNSVMLANRFTDKLQSDWDFIRADLNGLAVLYNLRPLQ